MLVRILLSLAIVCGMFWAVYYLGQKLPWFRLGRLPGDIVIQRDGATFVLPIASMLGLSLMLSVGFSLLRVFKR